MTFYDLLDSTDDFQEMIDIITWFDGDIFEGYFHQPECIVFRFGGMNEQEAEALANAMKVKFGLIALCCEESVVFEQPITLLDVLETSDDWCIEPEFKDIIVGAFIKCGFKRSKECLTSDMRKLFCSQSRYADEVSKVFMYDYDKMKHDREWLKRDLIQHFHHPNFIQSWIENGNDIENYMM